MTGRGLAHQSADVAPGWKLIDMLVALRRVLHSERLTRVYPYLLLIPGVVLVSLLTWGLLDLLWKSFHSYDSFLNRQGPPSLEQYRRLLFGPDGAYYRQSLTRTFEMSVLVTLGAVLGAIPVAYFIVRVQSRMWRMVALLLTLVPFLMGEVVRAFGWLILLGREGAVSWVLSLFRVPPLKLIGTLTGVWIGALQVMLPIAVFVLLPAVRRVLPDLERAAQTLGASPRRVWLEIVLPMVRPGLVSAGVVVFALTMTEFAIPDIVGAGVQPFVANVIQSVFFVQGNLFLGSALAVLLLLGVSLAIVSVLAVGRGRQTPRRKRLQRSEIVDGGEG